jgi:type I restriction enzyme S subunit
VTKMGWPVATLNNLCAPDRFSIAIGPFGSRMKADCYVPAGVPVIRGTNLSSGRTWTGNWVYVSEDFAAGLPNCVVLPGDLVLPHRGAIGEVGIVPNDGRRYLISSSLMKIRLDPAKAISEYVFYYLSSAEGRHEILRFGSQVGTPGIGQPLSSLRQMRVPLPPIHDQQAIATLLSALDSKVELNRRMNETLEASARALFRDWFVDFGPTRAKAEGRPAWLAPGLWSLFPDRLGADGVPEGWEWSTIGEEVEAVGGSTPSTKNAVFWDGGIAWTTPKDLSDLGSPILLETARTITEAGLRRISSGLLPAGTVLMSSRAPVGYLAIASVPVAVNQGYIAMKCTGRVSNWGAYIWAHENLDAIISNANGSTFQEISKRNFRPLPILVADDATRSAFDGLVGPMFERIKANVVESRSLAATRDALLPKLMSGELRVRDAEALAA